VANESARGTKVHLVHSKDEEPEVTIKATPGRRFEVTSASVVDTNLEDVAAEARDPDAVSATLCSGHGTCIAIIEIDESSQPQRAQ
jgi:hypothetical protein